MTLEYLTTELLSNSTDFDIMLNSKLKAFVLNETEMSQIYQNQLALLQKWKEAQAEIAKAMSEIAILKATTPRPIQTTTSNYVNENVAANSDINRILNRLFELQQINGIEYAPFFDLPDKSKDFQFSSDPVIDSEVKEMFNDLNYYNIEYNTDADAIKHFFDKMN